MAKKDTKKFMLHLSGEQHKTLKRRAADAEVTMNDYAISMLFDGKLNAKPKKS
jgi:predicted HicB family RNase H-like nuclease